MLLLAAIDILQGQAVRLAQGAFDARTDYDADPLDAARRWVQQGARALHVVDLDGARSGAPANLDHLRRICAELDVPVEVGGGLRNAAAVDAAIAAGAKRVVLGTAALTDVDFLDEMIARHGEDKVVVSLDARDGKLAASGWTVQTELPAVDVVGRLGDRGVRRFVLSSVERDGMMGGPDLEAARAFAAAVRGSFVYSGGVGSLEDLRALRDMRQVNLTGVIVGKALFEGRFTAGEGQAALDGRG